MVIIMITEELEQSLKTSLKQHLETGEWQYIDSMLDEIFLLSRDGGQVVVVKPYPEAGDLTMAFSSLTGAFDGMESWEYAKEYGERVK